MESSVYIKILQNGQEIEQAIYPLNIKKRVTISNSLRADLSLPLYPLTKPISLLKIQKGQIELNLAHSWKGLIVINGTEFHPDRERTQKKRLTLTQDDYAVLEFKDLQVLVKIGQNKADPPQYMRSLSGYRAPVVSHLFPDKYSPFLLAGSAVAALITVSLLGSPFLQKNRSEIKDFSKLSDLYTLSFINPDHLETSPEALKEHFKSSNIVENVINYYRSLIMMIIGNSDKSIAKFFDPKVTQRYRSMHNDLRSRVQNNKGLQSITDQKNPADAYSGKIHFAAVQGEGLDHRLARVVNLVNEVHDSQRYLLNERRLTSQRFLEQSSYRYEAYKSSPYDEDKPKERFRMGKLEKKMYDNVARLTRKSRIMYGDYFKAPEAPTNDIRPVLLEAGKPIASFLSDLKAINDSKKTAMIRASSFDRRKKTIAREPLIGVLNPQLVEKKIKANQFQLQLCYELALRRNDKIEGQMTWNWRINSRGQLLELRLVESNMQSAEMTDCVRSKIQKWTFPRPTRGSVLVTHSFKFNTKNG